jgi:hypothetical protein
MNSYIVIETESGLTVAEVPADKTAEQVATASAGVIVDPGPYKSFDDAHDAMQMLPSDEKERARLRE